MPESICAMPVLCPFCHEMHVQEIDGEVHCEVCLRTFVESNNELVEIYSTERSLV